MATIGGPNSAFELDLNKRLKELDKKIARHTDNISSILQETIDNPQLGARYWSTARRKIDAEYKALTNIITTWNKVEIPKAYRRDLATLMKRLNTNKTAALRMKQNFTQMATSNKASAITRMLYIDANISIVTSLTAGQANVNNILRVTQQALIQESTLNTEIARAIKNGNLSKTWYAGSNDTALIKAFKKNAELIDGKYYVQAGSRKYTVEYYTEMVARTKFHEAQSAAAVQTAGNYGTSLVQVSNHGTTTPVCLEHENKIYSIGGKDKRFPTLPSVPPYHPNCLHLLSPVFIEAMEVQGTVDEWSNFSKGETEVPPAPASFVPASEREVV